MSVITTLEAELGFIVADLKRLFSRAIATTPPSTAAAPVATKPTT